MDSHGRWPNFWNRKKDHGKTEDDEIEEEIKSIVEVGQEQGALEDSEAEMIQNIFEFGDRLVADTMTRRGHIAALDSSWTLQEAVNYIIEENHSRFPVFKEDVDDIIGMIHLRDVLIALQEPENQERSIEGIPGLIRSGCFVPETKSIRNLFQEMQSQNIHMEIAVDEYGQTAGVITMEDILEVIVGNIQDEYDEEEEPLVVKQADGTFLIDGSAPLDELEEILSITFDDEENETMNGFMITKLDRIPEEAERPDVEYNGYLFHTVNVENNRIQTVLAIPGQPAVKEPG